MAHLAAAAISCVLALQSVPGASPTTSRADAWADRGFRLLDRIDAAFLRRDRAGQIYYLEDLRPGQRTGSCFAWPAGVQLSAVNAAAALDPQRLPAAVAYAQSLDAYATDAPPVPGYNAPRRARIPDRYYDDNQWLAIDFADLAGLSGDAGVLDRGRKANAFSLSGEDATLGGGIFWHEQEKHSKNTCSNAPAIVAAMRVWSLTHEPAQLDAAKRLYGWLTSHLRDTDGLYFDHVDLDGKVARFKLTYNAALPIRAGCLLHAATGDAAYLHDAQQTAEAAIGRWCGPDGRMADQGRFAHLLIEALLTLAETDHNPRWASVAERAVEWQVTHQPSPEAWYPNRWGSASATTQPAPIIALIDQASMARACLRLALYHRHPSNAPTLTRSANPPAPAPARPPSPAPAPGKP